MSSLSKQGIFPHRSTWIHEPMQGKEFVSSKSPELLGSLPTSPQKSPMETPDRKPKSGIPTYVDLKKRLKEALREIDRLKAGGGFESSEGSSFVTPKAKRALLTGQAPKKSPKAKTKANADGHPQQAEITPADAESAEKATSDGTESIKVSSEVYKELLRETITSFLKSGLVFNKFGRNGKLYQRIVRWSKDMKSVEWFKSHQESPRYVLMNPVNNASVSVKANDDYDLCTLKSDHRTLELVLETRSQKHWAELTHQVVKNRGVSGYLETIDDHL